MLSGEARAWARRGERVGAGRRVYRGVFVQRGRFCARVAALGGGRFSDTRRVGAAMEPVNNQPPMTAAPT